MEQTKEEIVANLYALRAGLSIASGISEKTQDASARIDQINKIEIPNMEREVKGIPERIQEETKVYSNEVDEQDYCVKSSEKWIEELKEKEHSLRSTPIKIKSCLIVVCIFLVCFIVSAILSSSAHPEALKFLYISMAGGAISLGVFIKNYGWWRLDMNDLKETRTSLRESEKRLQEIKTEFERAKTRRAENEKNVFVKYNNLRKEIQEQQKKLENERLDCEAVVMIEKERFSSVYTALQNEFSSFLDERDWGNVDLIIFSYETGRALDLRDALLQVDNERRNQRLVNAVRDASRSISDTISRGFNEMSHSLSSLLTKFDSLDRNIASSMQSLGGNLSKMIEQNKAVGEKLQQISSISSAQEALQRKMYASSDEMASDIRYMRELSHRTYYGT